MDSLDFSDRQISKKKFDTIEEASICAGEYSTICFENSKFVWIRVIEAKD